MMHMDEEKLCRVKEAYKEWKQLKGKLEEFESMRISPRITAYGGERVQTSPKGDLQPDTIEKVDALIAVYNAKLSKCAELIAEFENAIGRLKGRDRRIMRLYYIDGMTWEKVCVEVDVSWMHLHRLRKKIMAKMQE